MFTENVFIIGVILLNILEIVDMYGKVKKNIPAHIHREEVLLFGELVEKSNSLACYIIEKYGEDKAPIIVYGHKQNNMLIAFLACVKAGHAYIPVDSSLPQERINDIINSSKAKLMLSVGELPQKFVVENILTSEKINEIISIYSDKEPDKSYQVKEEDTYYIIYTSGSTGKPKGVQITLGCLMSFIEWGLSLYNFDDNKQYVFMNQAPFSFDLSVMDLYLSLATGSTLFSIDKDMISNLKDLFIYFKKSKIDVWVSTPSFAEMCLADSKFNKELLNNLSLFLFCGETLTNSCVEKLHKRFSNSKVINLYGPTEATVAISAVEVDDKLNDKIKPLPVGKIKNDCKVIIVDKENKEVKEGQKGEILIIGDSVSVGYYNNREMSNKSFGTMKIDGKIKRCYKTGDEGYLKDGMLYYCGRIDFQVKLNGFRIELQDIENNIRKIDFIKNCVVLPVTKENKIQYLCAFVILNQAFEEKEFKIAMNIKNELRKFIPEYMIPRKIVIKDSFPMTQNGKINRKLLLEETR